MSITRRIVVLIVVSLMMIAMVAVATAGYAGARNTCTGPDGKDQQIQCNNNRDGGKVCNTGGQQCVANKDL